MQPYVNSIGSAYSKICLEEILALFHDSAVPALIMVFAVTIEIQNHLLAQLQVDSDRKVRLKRYTEELFVKGAVDRVKA